MKSSKLLRAISKYPAFKGYEFKGLVEMLNGTFLFYDIVINFSGKFNELRKVDTVNKAIAAFKKFCLPAFSLQISLIKATLGGERVSEESDKMKWGFQNEVYLSKLRFPADTDSPAETLWALLEEREAIKPPKFKALEGAYSKQKRRCKRS